MLKDAVAPRIWNNDVVTNVKNIRLASRIF